MKKINVIHIKKRGTNNKWKKYQILEENSSTIKLQAHDGQVIQLSQDKLKNDYLTCREFETQYNSKDKLLNEIELMIKDNTGFKHLLSQIYNKVESMELNDLPEGKKYELEILNDGQVKVYIQDEIIDTTDYSKWKKEFDKMMDSRELVTTISA